jgi:hypothetical protein
MQTKRTSMALIDILSQGEKVKGATAMVAVRNRGQAWTHPAAALDQVRSWTLQAAS